MSGVLGSGRRLDDFGRGIRSLLGQDTVMTAASVAEDALRLPEPERAELADRLLETRVRSSEAIELAWAQEAEARLNEYDSGHEASSDVAEVVRKLRSRFE